MQVRVTYGDEILTVTRSGDGLHDSTSSTSTVINQVTDTKSPTLNNSTDCNGWTNPSNAHASDNSYATAVADTGVFGTLYRGFGFAIPAGKKIVKVEVLLEWLGNFSTGITDCLDVGTPGTPDTCGNFVSLASACFTGRIVEGIDTADITAQFAWSPSDFDNANLRVLLTALHGVV